MKGPTSRRGTSYVPERGDVIWLEFDPQAGHKLAGRQPALVLSPASYNERVGLALVCPITTQVKGYPFEVALPAVGRLRGAVLSDQVKSLDWRMRHAQRFSRVTADVLEQTISRVEVLLRG